VLHGYHLQCSYPSPSLWQTLLSLKTQAGSSLKRGVDDHRPVAPFVVPRYIGCIYRSRVGTSAAETWAVLGTVLGSVGQCWAVLGSVGQCWAVLGSVGQCWEVLGSVGQCWAVLGQASERAFPDGSTACRGFPLASDTAVELWFRSGVDTARWNQLQDFVNYVHV
jgi:hypothetical protein